MTDAQHGPDNTTPPPVPEAIPVAADSAEAARSTEIDTPAALIREVDGKHTMGAAELAEALIGRGVTLPARPIVPTSVPTHLTST